MATPTLCHHGVTVSYHGKRDARISDELWQSCVFTRIVVAGQAVPVERPSPLALARAGATGCELWRIEGFFPVSSTSTLTVYIGFKSPRREETLLEAKFKPSRFARRGYDWDIIGSEHLQDEFRLSLEMQFLSANRRVNISYKTKSGTTSHIIPPSDNSDKTLDEEEQFLRKLLCSPTSKARATALIVDGYHLFARWEHTKRGQYLDLSIEALYAGHPSIQDRDSHAFFCHILFNRCTLPDADSFVGRAFRTLRRLDVIPDLDDEFLKPFLDLILQVLRKHYHPDYATVVFRVLAPSMCALYTSRKTIPEFFVHTTLVAFELAPEAKVTRMILDSTLLFISPVFSIDRHGELSKARAISNLKTKGARGVTLS
ncbi:hypothetical protein BDN72DRAFT_842385 [Pluteus cervinus]|uniref:Uncharacterized protein n=1 Tax=Pluteus cervinus TaxID=181527 RepID=A0ACD3AR51_9AGAR|nr:hypothetical protein BDN72DRAFT_842385 [Pluteus cervinus]